MDRNGVYVQMYQKAPAPSRDYYGLTVNEKEVILNIWNVSHGPHVYPKRQKCPINEFNLDKTLNWEVQRLFGNYVLEYIRNLSAGALKLECLPTRVFLYILRHLAAKDVAKLGQTSKIFFELCNRDCVWKNMFQQTFKKVSYMELQEVQTSGWKNIFKSKILISAPSLKPKKADIIKGGIKLTIENPLKILQEENEKYIDIMKPIKMLNYNNFNFVQKNKKITAKQEKEINPFKVPSTFYNEEVKIKLIKPEINNVTKSKSTNNFNTKVVKRVNFK